MSGAPKNIFQKNMKGIVTQTGQPSDDIERISYGIIDEINKDSGQVKVRFLNGDKLPGDLISEGFLPLINPLSEILLLYGPLRPGLLCRIYWRGKIKPQTAIIEVIGDEESSFLKKEPEVEEIPTGPYRILSGGLLPLA